MPVLLTAASIGSPNMSNEVKEESKTFDASTEHAQHADLEVGDEGIKIKAAPLARQLRGRHMQMIAIGTVATSHERRFG